MKRFRKASVLLQMLQAAQQYPLLARSPKPLAAISKVGNGKAKINENTDIEEAEAEEGQEENQTVSPSKKRATPPRQMQVMEIDFDAGATPFEEFCRQKNPTNDTAKYLTSAVWLKENAKIDPIGLDHMYTCYRRMKWKMPKDFGATFREGRRSTKGYYRGAAERGFFSITHIGEDLVNKMNEEQWKTR